MARDKCNPITLLSAVVDRLRAALTLDESACFLSLDPHVKLHSPADLTYVVSPLSGSFNGAMIDGGGDQQVTTETGFTVTIRSYQQLDEAGHDAATLTDTSLGVLQACTQVLQALTTWEPKDGDGNELLRDQMAPTGYEFGKDGRDKMFLTLAFSTVFDWDLSA